jgi:hypothetical protein
MNTLHENKHLIEGAVIAIQNKSNSHIERDNEIRLFNNLRIKALWERLMKYRQWYDISNV